MKKIKLKKMFILPFLLLVGCSDFLDVNKSPNSPEDVPLATMLPTGLVATSFANGNELNRFASTVTSYLYGAGGSPAAYDVYVINSNSFGNQWNGELYRAASIYRRMIDKAESTGAMAYAGISKIMMAYNYAMLTDIWGDIPYSEAGRGTEGIAFPRIDKQEDIYKGNSALEIQSLFDLVKEGISDLDQPSVLIPGVDDIVYGGNVALWKKAGNTLLLRLAITISRKEPSLAASIINEVIATNSFISSNTENLSVKYGGSVGSQSPIYTYIYNSLFQNDMMVSSRYINRLQALNDPRLPLFVTQPSGSYVTMDNGAPGPLPQAATWSRWSTVIVGGSGVGPIRLITNAMRAFMLAEAVVSIPGVTPPSGLNANTLFQDGIRASMSEAGLTNTQINAYFTANPTIVNLSGSLSNQVEQILTQKYIAMTGNGLEAWNDWRRTGFPILPEHQNAQGEDGKRPLRARYLDSEVSVNSNFEPYKNVKTNERVWWDID